MRVEIDEDIIRLCCGIEGGITNLNEILALGLGALLIEPRFKLRELGDLVEISYKSKEDNQTWSHEFRKPYPKLAATQTSLFVLNDRSKFNIKEGVGIIEPDVSE